MKRVAPSPVKEKASPHKRLIIDGEDMDPASSRSGSPTGGGPLQDATPERINQRRESVLSSIRQEGRDSSVHDKINQFNNLNSLSLSAQSKQLERKTADAALKRAMLGREEAEAELRRYRDDVKMLRKALEEGKERERKVGERLETVMENYGRTKETHAHTKALWEKEIRRARKETFKTQSTIVKLQEELKSARSTMKSLEESILNEKQRSHVREQEAFTSRYQIVGVQEELEKALERIKVVEQERDVFKTAAKNEEVARIAAEGRIPLPINEEPDDEFASPKKPKKAAVKTGKQTLEVPKVKHARVSLSTMEILSSEASELEIEELTLQVQWERQRADRAQEMIEFLQAECQMHCCPCSKNKTSPGRGHGHSHHSPDKPRQSIEVEEVEDAKMEDEQLEITETETIIAIVEEPASAPAPLEEDLSGSKLMLPKSRKERRSTIFCPQEGIFRTVSEQEAEEIEAHQRAEAEARLKMMDVDEAEAHGEAEAEAEVEMEAEQGAALSSGEQEHSPRMYARTPSVDPPAFALLAQERTSLLSLLNAPQNDAHTAPVPSMASVPTIPDEEAASMRAASHHERHTPESPDRDHDRDDHHHQDHENHPDHEPAKLLHASTSSYTVTTKVPVRDENSQPPSDSSTFAEKLRTPSSASSNTSFDAKDPALTPTMTREQALAKIRERRGRAKSANATNQASATAQKKMADGKQRRDMSAPTGKPTGVKKR